MKTTNTRKLLNILTGAILVFACSVPSLAYAGGRDHNKHWGHDSFKKVVYKHHDRDYRHSKDHRRDYHKKRKHHRKHSRNARRWGFDRGHHRGHDRGHGKRKGHKNHRNPWYRFYKARHDKDKDEPAEDPPAEDPPAEDPPAEDPAVTVDLTVRDRALNSGTTFNATYDITMTIQEVLADLLGSSTEGYHFQECYQTIDPLAGVVVDDCAADETLAPLDGSLTLEAAGIVDDPVVYLVFIAP